MLMSSTSGASFMISRSSSTAGKPALRSRAPCASAKSRGSNASPSTRTASRISRWRSPKRSGRPVSASGKPQEAQALPAARARRPGGVATLRRRDRVAPRRLARLGGISAARRFGETRLGFGGRSPRPLWVGRRRRPVYNAGDGLGRLLRTLYLCDYLSNPAFRLEILDLLNQGEAVHSLQRAIHNRMITATPGRTRRNSAQSRAP